MDGGMRHSLRPVVSDTTKTFHSNVAGVFLPLVELSNRKVIVNTSSGISSFRKDIASYSKTALNMLVSSNNFFLSVAVNPSALIF